MNEMVQIRRNLIVGAAMGNCVHVAGVANFLRLAEEAGYETLLLGAATPISRIVEAVDTYHPVALAVSYRLTPANGGVLLDQLLRELDGRDVTVLFGGTAEMVRIAEGSARIAACFTGGETLGKVRSVFNLLSGGAAAQEECGEVVSQVPVGRRIDSLVGAGDREHSVPLIRHHFGLPDLEATVDGVREIAEAGVLDILSIAPDQNAQEFFFRPQQMDPSQHGAGGVPLRTPEDLDRLYGASRHGNHPYLRIYSGTQDLLRWAQMSVMHLHNAWGTIPLSWYSELDGRSRRSLEEAIVENCAVMQWYAEREIAVEVNEAHHWSLRDAPDTVAVAMAYIAARMAKKAGVRQFFAQYMFNTPSYTSPIADVAKMMAKLTLIESLRTDSFVPYRQVRAGLTHFTADLNVAKGQLAMATALMLQLQPHIVHVVGFCEADHAAKPSDVIESCKIVQGVMRNSFMGSPSMLLDPRVRAKYEALLEESMLLIGTIERFGTSLGRIDPLTDPVTLAQAIRCGILDAPHLAGQPCALGRVRTAPFNGGCHSINQNGQPVSEGDRLLQVLRQEPAKSLCKVTPNELIANSQSAPPDSPLIRKLLS